MGEILFYSVIIGAIGGGCLAAGAARMFHAPEVQAMGSFRTLGEMNACGGDPISHFSFGLGFLFSSAASAVAAGALTQDVFHRIVTNWGAGILMLRDKSENAMQNPAKMMIAGAGVGAVVVALLNSIASIIPANLSAIASGVLVPATTWLINPVLPPSSGSRPLTAARPPDCGPPSWAASRPSSPATPSPESCSASSWASPPRRTATRATSSASSSPSLS